MVKNNKIINLTWGVHVSMMYFPIDISFSFPTKDVEKYPVETGYDLAMEKALAILDTLWDGETPDYQYKFDLEIND